MLTKPTSTKKRSSSLPEAITAPVAAVIQVTEAVTRDPIAVIRVDTTITPFL